MRLIIDGPYLSRRSYGISYHRMSATGVDSTMIHTFFKSLTKLAKENKPNQIVVAWESHGTLSWRRQLYPRYKPSKDVGTTYLEQLKDVQYLLELLGIKQYWSPTNEADDVIAMLLSDGEPTRIFTIDKDIFQLVDDAIPIEIVSKGIVYNEAKVQEKFGVYPHQIPIYLALVGDTTDNIPGIPKIGEVKARKYIKDDTISTLSEASRQKFELYRRLTTLNRDGELLEVFNKEKPTREEIYCKYDLKEIKIETEKRKSIL